MYIVHTKNLVTKKGAVIGVFTEKIFAETAAEEYDKLVAVAGEADNFVTKFQKIEVNQTLSDVII